MKEKILRTIHALVGLCTVAPLVAGSISATKAVIILASASAAKEILIILGDLFDDWTLNKSFSAIAIGFLVMFGMTGCASSGPSRLARELAKDPNAAGFSIQLVTPWGQQIVSFARGTATNNATAEGGGVTIGTR